MLLKNVSIIIPAGFVAKVKTFGRNVSTSPLYTWAELSEIEQQENIEI